MSKSLSISSINLKMLVNLLGRLLKLSSEDLSSQMVNALGELGQLCAANYGCFALFSRDKTKIANSYEWCAKDVGISLGFYEGESVFTLPWMGRSHLNREIIDVPSVSRMLDEAALEMTEFSDQGIKSLISVPLIIRDESVGFLCLATTVEEMRFDCDSISILTVVADSLANAIDRKKIERAIRDKKQRYQEFADMAADWFWETDADLKYSYLSDRYQAIVGVQRSAHIGMTWTEIFAGEVDDSEVYRKFVDDFLNRRFVELSFSWLHPDGEVRVLKQTGRPKFGGNGNFLGYRGIGRDITESHRAIAQIAYQASHDALTGLVNCREFRMCLKRALKSARDNRFVHVLGFIDLDRFKRINDMAGHSAGDVILRGVASILAEKIRSSDTLGRLGGDEFGLLLEICSLDEAVNIVEGIIKSIKETRFRCNGQPLEVSLSIGLTCITGQSQSADEVLARADMACYMAKHLGADRLHILDVGESPAIATSLSIEKATDGSYVYDDNRAKLN